MPASCALKVLPGILRARGLGGGTQLRKFLMALEGPGEGEAQRSGWAKVPSRAGRRGQWRTARPWPAWGERGPGGRRTGALDPRVCGRIFSKAWRAPVDVGRRGPNEGGSYGPPRIPRAMPGPAPDPLLPDPL